MEDDHQAITVPLTQAGLKFSNRLLRTSEIEHANALIEHHLSQCDENIPPAESGQLDPTIVSYAGIGRNAALITYREVLSRIINDGLSEDDLDDALEDTIAQGRRDRGPKFLHSEAQAEEVRASLCKSLRDREQALLAQNLPSPRRPIFGMHVYEHPAKEAAQSSDSGAAAPIDPVQITLESDHRAQILSVLESHLEATPLQLFDALSNEPAEAAAFCAVQTRRMLTAQSETKARSNSCASVHAGVEVAPTDPKSVNVFSEPAVVLANDTTSEQNPKQISFQEILLDDFKQATLPPTDPNEKIGKALFPQGLSAALRVGRRDEQQEDWIPAEKIAPEQLDAFFQEHSTATTLDLVEKLAINNPEMATLIDFIDHGLLLSNSINERQCERYEYVGHADESKFIDKNKENRQYFFPTFFYGVERPNRHSKNVNSNYQVLDGHEWKPIDNKVEIFQHVISHAKIHLDLTECPDDDAVLYPLPVYKLLAKATGYDSIPPYLQEHEERIYATVTENKRVAINQKEQNAQAYLERERIQQEKIAESKLRVEQRIKEMGAGNLMQALLANSGYSTDLPNNSIDITIPLSSETRNPELIENIHAELLETHEKQTVSSRAYDWHNQDNLSWLRSSWLSVFSSILPQDLTDRLSSMTNNQENMQLVLKREAPILQAIAQLYRNNPTAFIQGMLPNVTDDLADVPSWDRSLQCGAHLGANLPIKEIFADSLSPAIPGVSDTLTIEKFLHELQIQIATAFRTEDPTLLGELQRLHGSSDSASSTLPISLHRAFGLPIMVVEKGSFDTAAGPKYVNQLRVAVPTGADAEDWLRPLNMQPEVDENVIATLSIEFADKPVIWIEDNRHEIYLPKRFIENHPNKTTESVQQHAIEPHGDAA